MEKQKILYQQARLHARGAAEMVLQMISASKGKYICCPTVSSQMIFSLCSFWVQQIFWCLKGAYK